MTFKGTFKDFMHLLEAQATQINTKSIADRDSMKVFELVTSGGSGRDVLPKISTILESKEGV